MENDTRIRELFGTCDLDGSGYIDRHELAAVCDLDESDLSEVFYQLDIDNDGKISIEEFSENFQRFSSVVAELKTAKSNSKLGYNSQDNRNKRSFTTFKKNVGIEPSLVSSQQYISELYYNLTNSNQPDLLDLFEKHLASVVKDIKARAAENQRLEEALKRATKQHERQVNNLDHEVEQQMEKMEAKVRQEERSLSEKKLSDLKWQMENKEKEIGAMNKTIETLQGRLNKEISKPSRKKDEMDNLSEENRFLKSQVTDSQTALALLRSELVELRGEFEEQSELLQKEQTTLHDCLQEQENLTRQLQLLHEANQKLHDINDELRGALEAKRSTSTPRKNSGDVMKLSGIFSDSGRDLSSTKHSRPRSATPALGGRMRSLDQSREGDGSEKSFNEDSLLSEIRRANSTEYANRQNVNDSNATNDNLTIDYDTSRKTGLTGHRSNGDSVSRTVTSTHKKFADSLINQDENRQTDNDSKIQNGVLAKIMAGLTGLRNKKSNCYSNREKSSNNILANSVQQLKIVKKSTSLAKSSTEVIPKGYEIKVNESYTETERQCSNGEFQRDFVKIKPEILVLRKPDVETDEPIFCDRMDSSVKTTKGNNQTQDEKETVTEDGRVTRLSVARSGTNKNIDRNTRNNTQRTLPILLHSESRTDNFTQDSQDLSSITLPATTSLEELHTHREIDLVHCTYEQFERLLKAEIPSRYFYSSSPDSFDLTSVSNIFSLEPYKLDADEEEPYTIQKQIQILEDTNKRLSSSNDELRVALKLMSRSGSFRKSKKSSPIRRTPSNNSDYGSLSSRSSRSFSPKQKRTSPGDVGDATDESTTYDAEDDDNVGIIFEESLENIEQDSQDVEGAEKSTDEFIIKNTTDINNDDWSENLDTLNHDGKSPQDSSQKENSDYNDENKQSLNFPLILDKLTRHESLECINEKPLNGSRMYTRSKSLELFYFKNFTNMKDFDENGRIATTQNNKLITRQGHEENNNAGKGLWDITRKLNAYEQFRSQSSLEKLHEVEDEFEDEVEDEDQVEDERGVRDAEAFSESSEEEMSSDEDGSESSGDSSQVSDSTTMNSETIAELETQFMKIKEYPDDEEMHKNQEHEDEDEEDDVNSEEIAELVAMASDLTDVSDSDSDSEPQKQGDMKRRNSSTMTTDSLDIGTPERMYKLVLAGDAAVGKSSFILRLCRNKFHNNLNATLGVDFQVKNIRVDSKTVALQLWDTAGQERFRSIAKSYFRKVDGVLLLYDVTSESSFVNIREWMQTIEESSPKKVPIMLCGNKCDLRDEFIQEGRKVITRESGERLAKAYNALFIETSAKDGKHIEDACKDLARILTSIENEEIQQSGMKLDKRDKEKKKKPCCSS